MLIIISARVLRVSSSIRRFTGCMRFTAEFSLGCCLQRADISLMFDSSGMRFLSKEPAGKDVLDAMNLHSDIAGRESGNFGDLGGLHIFEVAKHDLAVQRLQSL